MEIEIIRSKRKTIALEIKRDGRVLVRAPQRMSEKDINRFVEKHRDWLNEHYKRVQQKLQAHPEPSEEEVEKLRRLAKEILPGRVAYWSGLMGVKPTSMKVTSARTRYGSCSSKNAICFSLYLMRYPMEAVDYVVVHELAHIRQHNHSKAFYEEIARVMPDYKERIKLLKSQ